MSNVIKTDGGLHGVPPVAPVTGSAFVRVVAIAPFWRYAVGPTAGHSPAIPFYRLSAAMALFDEAKQVLPWAGVTLYKRRWFRGLEAVKEYSPNTKPSDRPEGQQRNP